MATAAKKVSQILQREFITGTVYRVDLDRVDVAPAGSTGILRGLPLSGDRDKIQPGDTVSIVSIGGERVAMVGDLAVAEYLEDVVEDAGIVELEERIQIISAGEDVVRASGSGWVVFETDVYPTGWQNRLISDTTGMTEIDLYDTAGLPLETTLVNVELSVKDAASMGYPNTHFTLYTAVDGVSVLSVIVGGQPNNNVSTRRSTLAPIPVTNGKIYYQANTTSANSMTFSIKILNYYAPQKLAFVNADSLQGYAPRTSGNDAHVVLTDGLGNLPSGDWRMIEGGQYLSSTSIMLTGDWTDALTKGTKFIIMYNTTPAYFYVVNTYYSAANNKTNVTFLPNADYSVTTAGISYCLYSHAQTPEGYFPEWFSFTPGWSSTGTYPSVGNGTLTGRYVLDGVLLTYQFKLSLGTTSTFGTGNYTFTLPWYPHNVGDLPWFGQARLRRPAAWNYYFMVHLNPSDTVLQYFFPTHQGGLNNNNITATSPVTWATTDRFECQIQYKI